MPCKPTHSTDAARPPRRAGCGVVALRLLIACAVATPVSLAMATDATLSTPAPPGVLDRQASRPTGLLPPGPLTTRGNQIVDRAGNPVRLACVGYFAPGNLARDIAGMVAAGFNCVRYPWYDATLPAQLGVMDRIVALAGRLGLRVVFDHHGNETPGPLNGYLPYPCNGLPIDKGPGTDGTDGCGDPGTVDAERFVADWALVAKRYAGDATVIAFDLTNEPHRAADSLWHRGGGATWGDGAPTDLKRLYESAGNAIQQVNPSALIVCEGIGRYGGNLSDGTPMLTTGIVDLSFVARQPVTLRIPNQVVYSVHDYPAPIGDVRPDSGPVKIRAMNAAWGYLVTNHIAPVWIGEMGASLDGEGPDSKGGRLAGERAWASTLVDYVNGAHGAQGGPTFSGPEQPIGTNWWAWGNLTGQRPNGTLNRLHQLRPAQQQVYQKLR